jgi:hypothetical protein
VSKRLEKSAVRLIGEKIRRETAMDAETLPAEIDTVLKQLKDKEEAGGTDCTGRDEPQIPGKR